MSLAVIGAGLPRTGTMSLKLALEQLGLGPCYHMIEIFGRPNDWPLWETAAKGGTVDFDALLQDWRSITDIPGCNFYRELANLYPDAKLILTVRDPERWFASTQATVLGEGVASRHDNLGTTPMLEALGWGADPRMHERDYMLDMYHRHNEEVRRTVPAERLLVYDVAEGWEPLCRFLQRPVPDTPFPHSNSTEDFNARVADRLALAERAGS